MGTKRLLAVIGLLTTMLFGSSTGFAAQVQVRGGQSCVKWVETHRIPDQQTGNAAESWVLGFLSGMVVANDENFLEGTDNESIFQWITNYCTQHPLEHLGDATRLLSHELRKKKAL